MKIKRKITEEIRIYYTFRDPHNRRHTESAIEYLERHGWKRSGGFCGDVCVDGKEYSGCYEFVKQYQDEDEIRKEMEDINTLISLTE